MTPEKKRKGGAHLMQKPARPKKDKKPRVKEDVIRRRVTVLAIVAAVLLSLAVALSVWVREPTITPPPTPGGDVVEPGDSGLAQSSDRKEGVYTFLLLGRDTGGGGNTDTMMVASYDTKNQTVDILNIYRDTMVNAPWDIKRVNAVYGAAGGKEEGVDSLKDYLRQLIGFAPDFAITVEWEAVGQLVEAIGGVDFYVPYEMHYWDPTQNLRINQAKGQRTLNGDDAMQVIRWRKNNDGSKTSVGDIGRVEIQQDFLKAVVEQCLKTINISTVPKFAQIFLDHVTTDIPLGNMVWFGKMAMGLSADSLRFHSLPGNLNGAAWSRSYQNYQSYVLPDGPAIVELVNTYFNPYKDEVKLSDLDIMSVNRDGSLSSSKGTVRDSKAAKPPVIPSKAPPEPDDDVDVGGTGESEPPEVSPSPSTSQPPATGSTPPSPSGDIPPEFQTPRPSATPPAASGNPGGTPTLPPLPTAEASVPPVTPTPVAPTPTPLPSPSTGPDIPPEFMPAMPTPAG